MTIISLIENKKIQSFPEMPMIDWFTFISRTRVRYGAGMVPASFIGYSTKKEEGPNSNRRKKKMAKKPAKKATPMKPKKGGKKGC